jgi:hypothetical protein
MTLEHALSRDYVTPVFTLLVALVPVAGVALFGWRAAEILAVYWVAVAAVVVGHSVAVWLLAVPVAFVGLLVASALFGDAIAGSEPVVPGAGPFRPATSADPPVLAYVILFALAAAAVDRLRRLASSRSTPTGFTAWFLPEDHRSE